MKRTRLAAILLTLLACSSFAQEQQPPPTAASLIEQGKSAEERRKLEVARDLYAQAIAAAKLERNAELAQVASGLSERVTARIAGIAAPESQEAKSQMIWRLADRMDTIFRASSSGETLEEALNEVAVLGAFAVPWLERAISAPFEAEGYSIQSNPPRYIRALAMMSAPEAAAALERLLSSPDPLSRRAVAQFASPERHRAILLRALRDPAQAVRDRAIETLAQSPDPALLDTMTGFARQGDNAALGWLRNRPAELLRIASDAKASLEIRTQALGTLTNASSAGPDVALIDGLLALAKEPGDKLLRERAMEVLIRGLSNGNTSWRPIPTEISRRIESAVLAAPDAFPQPYIVKLLEQAGGAASLALIVERTPTDDLNSTYSSTTRIVGMSSPADFLSLIAALARLPGTGRQGGTLPHDQVLRNWIESAAPLVTSAMLANGAKELPEAARRWYLERVVASWLDAHTRTDAALAKLPKLDPAFIELLREMAATLDGGQQFRAARVLGASGDARGLTDLVALGRSNEIPSEIVSALRHATQGDPQRTRSILQALSTNTFLTPDSFANAVRNALGQPVPKDVLSAVKAAWSPANAERLVNVVIECVPGTEGNEFLLAHYAELGDGAASTRQRVIQRLGSELYSPALDLIGAALGDSNASVRTKAGEVFERFKLERQRVKDFQAWRSSDAESQKTVGELIALLASENPTVVTSAIHALTSLKARSALPQIIKAVDKHTESSVREAVEQAIKGLSQ